MFQHMTYWEENIAEQTSAVLSTNQYCFIYKLVQGTTMLPVTINDLNENRNTRDF